MKFFKRKSKREIMLEELETSKEILKILKNYDNDKRDFITLDLTKELETLNQQVSKINKKLKEEKENAKK